MDLSAQPCIQLSMHGNQFIINHEVQSKNEREKQKDIIWLSQM